MVVSLPIHRGERPRTPLESAPTAFSQLCTAVSQHGWLTRERLSRLLGTLNPPAPLAHRCLQGRLVHAHLPRGVLRVLLLSGPSRIRSPWARRGVQAVAQPPKVRDRVSLDYGVHRLTSGRDLWQAPATATATVERLDWRRGRGHAGAQRHLGCLGVTPRAHHQTALAPLA